MEVSILGHSLLKAACREHQSGQAEHRHHTFLSLHSTHRRWMCPFDIFAMTFTSTARHWMHVVNPQTFSSSILQSSLTTRHTRISTPYHQLELALHHLSSARNRSNSSSSTRIPCPCPGGKSTPCHLPAHPLFRNSTHRPAHHARSCHSSASSSTA